MSRVGKQPIEIPSGVKAAINGDVVAVEGPKGKLEVSIGQFIKVEVVDGSVVCSPESNSRQAKANWGTTRSLIVNAIKGVTEGWEKKLELSGVGFTVTLAGDVLTLATGYSHKSEVKIPPTVKCSAQKQSIDLESCDKQLVGQVAAAIRSICPPEPYLGKGVRYAGENVRRKAGKAGAK